MPPAQCSLRDVSFCHLFPHEVTRALAYHLTLAIAYTHSQGYVHGDVHLRNILVQLRSPLDHLSIEQFYKTYGEPETIQITHRDGKPLPFQHPSKSRPPAVPWESGGRIYPHRCSCAAERFWRTIQPNRQPSKKRRLSHAASLPATRSALPAKGAPLILGRHLESCYVYLGDPWYEGYLQR
ncbi:predicted protein [Aspergillus terreus NIH2624]|uniref:Protein kinase domain-containing protein n=1 Tax=Aspergillus terreus (strain NIH 2624 / FGSC A1156) TaxID=341663 RepID=Q0CUX0_ASPTN|nr:uncharacterized protein ATEG_02514 [Aspergillus terreus NIH2624]EAU37476.1 predicted protein [Aspergillus terreus NIH2624]